ncbi:hypothetical protein NPX13_g729 [Xylaria arbuscula]|uniref:Uncharacterized protein n=1 Tax=Xylaria arbuscula TaxID=114810 RepID=A0A9W8TSB9_9PEZI|nr:hypothetical protein NPX13_g729 [Xylaria arbuscula]
MEIQYEPLRTASSVLEIGGELYVISSRVRKVASSETGKRMGEVLLRHVSGAFICERSRNRLPRHVFRAGILLEQEITDSRGLSGILQHPKRPVADTFRACRDRHCRECSMLVNTKGFVRRRGDPKDGETVKMLTVGGNADQEYDAKSGHFVDLQYQPQNLGYDTFGKFTVHRGELRTLVGTTLTPRLTEIDAGSLVSQNGCYIGIVEWLAEKAFEHSFLDVTFARSQRTRTSPDKLNALKGAQVGHQTLNFRVYHTALGVEGAQMLENTATRGMTPGQPQAAASR